MHTHHSSLCGVDGKQAGVRRVLSAADPTDVARLDMWSLGKGSKAMDLDDVVREARKQNFTVEHTRNQHLRFVPPDKSCRPVTTGGTPSDKRALQNLISDLRRYAGFKWDRSGGKGKR